MQTAAERESADERETAAFGPVNLVVIQPTPFCNLDCDYCYLPDRRNRSRIDPELVSLTLERVLESPWVGETFTVLWHAGEPLAMPIAFYDDAGARIRAAERRWNDHRPKNAPPLRIEQHVQTNATVIDERWCACLRRNGIAVGVSLDGPAFLHDAHRRTRAGLGSHGATMRGIANLRRHGIPFSVITVLTAESLGHADALFDFYLENGITEVGFNMEETEGANRLSSLAAADGEARYRAFLERFWERSEASGGAVRVREFAITAGLATGTERLDRTDLNHPFVIVNVDHRGNFSTFDPELLAEATETYGDFVLGNVRSDSLLSVCATEKFRRMHRDMRAGVALCRSSCDYFGLCGGGAGSNKYWEHGTFACTETQACRYRIQVVADVVLAGLEASLGLAA